MGTRIRSTVVWLMAAYVSSACLRLYASPEAVV